MTEQRLPPFFYEVFHPSLPRLGPGDDASTLRALDSALKSAPTLKGELRILDVGCGTGVPTLLLARHVPGAILAIDIHQPFLDELMRRARQEGLSDRIHPRLVDLREPIDDIGVFDLIWSEGVLSLSTGFPEGLALCRRLLAPGGRVAVSDLCWLKPDPPQECRDFFDVVAPATTDVETNLTLVRDAGLETIDHFTLPESSWLDEFYRPLEQRVRLLRTQNPDDPERIGLLDSVQAEIDLYRKSSFYWGYEFFVMRGE